MRNAVQRPDKKKEYFQSTIPRKAANIVLAKNKRQKQLLGFFDEGEEKEKEKEKEKAPKKKEPAEPEKRVTRSA